MMQLGCGLLAIGRSWGTTPRIPSDFESQAFLQYAYDAGVRFFDTAPSYGLSETRLGLFLKSLSPIQRKDVIVSTKFGELYKNGQSFIDHTDIRASIEQSLQLLGEVNIIQVHKATPAVLRDLADRDIRRVISEFNIGLIGASVSDTESLKYAADSEGLSYIQCPFNDSSQHLLEGLNYASAKGKKLIINRPLKMGEVPKEMKDQYIEDAFSFILDQNLNGIVLTGTSNIEHLKENITLFKQAGGFV